MISGLAAALMVIAAVNLVLVFVLLSNYRQIGGPGNELPIFLPYLAVGVLPFLVTAALIVWTVVGREPQPRPVRPGNTSLTGCSRSASSGCH